MSKQLGRTARIALFMLLAAVSYAAAYALRFGGDVPPGHGGLLLATMGVAVVVKLVSFCWHRLDRGANRYVGFHDVVTFAKATTWGSIGLTLADAFLIPHASIPRGVVLIDWGATLLAIGLVRSAPRLARDLRSHWRDATDQTRVLIVGADDEGESLLRMLRTDSRLKYKPIGFIDPDPKRLGQQIGGIAVLGAPDDVSRLVANHRVDEVLITSAVPGPAVRGLVAESQVRGFSVRVLPSYDQLLSGRLAVQPRPVAIEDLLRRPPVALDQEAIGRLISGKTVLVTGSSGSIGSEICRQLLKHDPGNLVVLDRSETGQFFLERELRRIAPEAAIEVVLADATDRERLDRVFADTRPDVVFHAAAYKHVPLMEQHPGEGVKNIVLATRNLADAAEEHGVGSFVMVSTDKAVRPTSVMGSCKQMAERYVQAKSVGSACRFITVRFGNVLDSAGSVIPIFREQIAQGGPITVTHPDINRFFMMIPEAAQLVIQAGVMGVGGEIFVLDMGEPVRIVDLARDMIRLSGLEEGEDIEIEITGLRPGEKLYEELYGEEENHLRTSHEKIMAAESVTQPLLRVIHDIGRLEAVCNESPTEVRELLGEIVPRLTSPAAAPAAKLAA
ncbi:UDP-N-acetyl-alpha-D-glucosamine C6 dehydratase [Pseudobythopirellula maris]|uniref:UDP-N-acetyl-alpha-D-glucosamine C6 dehydratase n=1 Tax=Pseudobythopirellula maris TaxID=2527991 RepID=A0A5C5ZIU6_9BACT|nr:nucleoside-diphosphate sugar epimerase/dehydratase [Pseudobythopirellula maris]TWT87108.1 UDP-N-acetyl-alpha-D-glucosamine C6 dehydratase [Pseudobythopirellula maris]